MSNIPLQANTTYWVVARVEELEGFSSYRVLATDDTSQTGPGTIGDFSVYTADDGISWTVARCGGPIRMQINADFNAAPVAVAGLDQSTRLGDTVQLDGSGSFDDNTSPENLIYQWSLPVRPAGSTATLDNPSSITPTFVVDVTGTYIAELLVIDQQGRAGTIDSVSIGSDTNLAPTAVATASNTMAIVGEILQLDASGSSDPDFDTLFFAWSLTGTPTGSGAAIVNTTSATPTFTADLPGDYEITLIVSDFIGPGEPAVVNITAAYGIDFAEEQIIAACDIVDSLANSQVKTKGNQTALCNFLTQAVQAIQNDDIPAAIDKVNKSIDRVDGCSISGVADGNGPGMDWVIDCVPQEDIYDLLIVALDILSQ